MSGEIESQIICGRKWYFTKEEIEKYSPSRKDGIDLKSESHLRHLYCTFIQEIGIKLKVPQLTIACAMMLCHQFYMRQSHAKNDWQTVATGCIFLACKVEETPRYLNDSVVVAYEMTNKWDPSAPRRIRQKEFFDKQKELILVAERLILSTIAFDLNIQLPYKLLITALKRLDILPDLAKVAWNFINDWIRTTLCLQYKPHYIAAGSLYLAAKLQKVKLPTEKGRVWWMEFDVSMKQLEEVIQEMRRLLGHDRKPATPSTEKRYPMAMKSSSQSCVSSMSIVDSNSRHKAPEDIKNPVECDHRVTAENATSNSGSASSVVEDSSGEVQPATVDSNHKPQSKDLSAPRRASSMIDVDRIREVLKKRKFERVEKKSSSLLNEVEMGSEAWIESQLESGIEVVFSSVEKKQRKVLVL